VAYLALWFRGWESLVVMTGVRFIICLLGFYAIGLRRVKYAKAHYGLFGVSGFFAFLTIIPVLRSKCDCSDWVQSEVLKSFNNSLVHEFWNPSDYKEPPGDPNKAKEVKLEDLERFLQMANDSKSALEVDAGRGTKSIDDGQANHSQADFLGPRRLISKGHSRATNALEVNVAAMEQPTQEAQRRQRTLNFSKTFAENQKEMMKMKTEYEQDCVCDPMNGTKGEDSKERSCQGYRDTSGHQRFWCWVGRSTVKACMDKNKKMFWNAQEDRVWSEDLCRNNSCDCSHKGMLPRGENKKDIIESDFHGDMLRFGIACARYRTSYERSWCFVGYDSVCADRILKYDGKWTNNDFIGYDQTMQYRSFLPCNQKEENRSRERAGEKCRKLSMLAKTVFVVTLLLYAPMAAILFKFLSNRCGDELHCREQFAVITSSSEDEWQSGAKRVRATVKLR